MSEFPRAWLFTNAPGGGNAPSITVPAANGIVHVLTDFYAKVYSNNTTTPLAFSILLSSSDGVFNNFVLGLLAVADVQNSSQYSIDTDSASFDIAAGPGASLTISSNGSLASAAQFLRVQGYDI
jgi:hypothetical protein